MTTKTRVVLELELPEVWEGAKFTDWDWDGIINLDDSFEEIEDKAGGTNSDFDRVDVRVVSIDDINTEKGDYKSSVTIGTASAKTLMNLINSTEQYVIKARRELTAIIEEIGEEW